MSSELEAIAKELKKAENRTEEPKFTLKQEIIIILVRVFYIFTVSFLTYYGVALILSFPAFKFSDIVETVLSFSFFGFIISVFLLGLRTRAASSIVMASGLRTAWTGKKMDTNVMKFYSSFAFGVKWDTIAFWGSVFVFSITYIFFR